MTHILLVDDEPAMTRSLSILLQRNATVLTANSGQEALEILRSNTIHVLICDQRMPELTGVDVLQQACTISPHTTRIMLTGYADLDAVVDSVNEGEVFRYISKPWNNQELKSIVAEAAKISQQAYAGDQGANQTSTPVLAKNLLVLDEDLLARTTVESVVGNRLTIYSATNVEEARQILESQPISIIISELKLSTGYITDFILSIKKQYPDTLTLVQTSILDSQRIIDLINQGRIFRYLPKPMRTGLMKLSLERAMERAQLV